MKLQCIKEGLACSIALVLLCFVSLNTISIHCKSDALEVDLKRYELRLISQNGEDGILQKIFKIIGTTNNYYVEFGAGKGHYGSNTKYLREKYGWKGLLLEGDWVNDPSINLHQAFITAENICSLFEKYNVPTEFDLISIDIDGNDFYVWKALSKKYRPRVVIIEFNPCFNWNEDKVIVYNPQYRWDGSEYSGASMLALYNLGRDLGYSLVYQESSGANLFFIRDDIITDLFVKTGITFKNINVVSKLYNATPKRLDPYRRKFVSSREVLRHF